MNHFDTNNTDGYTVDQIASANRQVQAWCELIGFNPARPQDETPDVARG